MASAFGDALAIARFHIVLIATLGTVTFGWLLTGRYLVAAAGLCALDWFLVNLFNRLTDLTEDLQNSVPGTEWVARARRMLAVLGTVLLVGSLAATAYWHPGLLPWRVLMQALGLAYNYPLLPLPQRRDGRLVWARTRFKEVYAWKNLSSALIFIVTCFGYPLAWSGTTPLVGWAGMAALAAYFFLFELSYEIFYDLRDLPGDRLAGVPTFPVVHGAATATRIIDALLVASASVIVVAVGLGWLGLREALLVVAPLVQWLVYRPRVRRGLGAGDGVFITHLGSAELGLFLVGTAVWLQLGLPANVFLRASPSW